MTVARREYEVRGWGVGELWIERDVVVAHEFDFRRISRQGRLERLGTTGTFLDIRSDPADPACASAVDAEVISRVGAFLRGEEVGLEEVAIDLDWCTGFQREVLGVLRDVPRGEVVSYGEVAALAGHPGAQRAVGTICATNRFAFLVPCHRVVGAGGIGGYGSAGVDVKRRLLALEGVSL